MLCGGRKRPQNSKVGAESAPKMSKWGQKVPPQFGHDKIRMKVNIKVGAESAPQNSKVGAESAPQSSKVGAKSAPTFINRGF